MRSERELLVETHRIRELFRMKLNTLAARFQRLAVAAQIVIDSRDHHSDAGCYPPPPLGPTQEQCFDDWAADTLDVALHSRAPEPSTNERTE